MQRALRHFAGIALAAVAVAVSGQTARAQVTITGFYIPGPNFTYQLFVNNASPETLALVTVDVPAVEGAATDLVAPAGFLMTFDPGFGTVDLLEDIDPVTPQSFAPGTVQGAFTFRSPFDVSNTTFSGLDVQGNPFSGTLSLTLSSASAPEPGVLPLMFPVGALALGAFISKRRSARR